MGWPGGQPFFMPENPLFTFIVGDNLDNSLPIAR